VENWWKSHPWRMIQTNMRQIDMADIQADSFVDELKKFNATVLLINTGGIIASYQTEVEDHFQSQYLTGDTLKDVMDACKKAGIRVIARMDFSKVREPIYQKHPDWAYRTANGDIVNYNGDVHACIAGGYQQSKAFEIIREVVTTLPVDGLFINMGGFQVRDYSYNYYGICHCDNCKQRFYDKFGLALPKVEDMDDPVFRKYRVYQRDILADYKQRLEKTIHGLNPDIAIDGIDFTRMESNTEYKRPLPFWQYSASSNTRVLRGINGSMVSSNTTVDFIGFFYRHVSVNPEEQALRLWQNVANFGGVDYYVIGRLDNHMDKSGYDAIKEVFQYSADHQDEYQNIAALAEVLVIRRQRWENVSEERGWIRALTEAHILFDEIQIGEIKPDDSLKKYKAVILPATGMLPGWFSEKLDRYVHDGGCVIASGEIGKYNEDYELNNEYPLKSMGVEKVYALRKDMASAMLKVSKKDFKLFNSLSNKPFLYFGDEFLFAKYQESSTGYFKLIPPHWFGPPERCYYTQVTDIPGLQVNAYGKGRGILIPWTPGLLYYRDGYANTFDFMKDLLINVVGILSVEAEPFTPMLEVTAGVERTGKHALIQLVNNSGHFGTSYFQPIPIQNVMLKIPLQKAPVSVVTQTNGKPCSFDWENGILLVTVPQVNAFEGLLVHFHE
jgi:hypothetical protein